ncbi:MAG TPA: ATP-dependent helicase [Nitrospirae bacterium]|nr:ATP-dependent helicase [Nitrospirota bacterium]
MEDLHKILNESQYEAVTTLQGPILVIAGAGSGKTRVIEYRSLNLITKGIHPSSILLLTFTRRASQEMITRASRHDPRCKDIDGGTFHSFAYRMLKRYSKAIGFKQDLIVLDESDSKEAIHRCANALNLYNKDKRFPKKDTLKTIISMSINKSSPISEIIKREYPHFTEYIEDIKRLAVAYGEYKIKRAYIDYDDMLIYLKAMLEDQGLRQAITRPYKYVMIDEYQDTNALQGAISILLAGKTGNIMVVGDDAQSIYGFRGANHKNIMDFPSFFENCKIIRLELNYRSYQRILDCANALLNTMDNKYQKCLHSVKDNIGVRPNLYFFKNTYEEAEWIADFIKDSLADGVPLHHHAVLCRSMYLTIPLQAELSKRNIPYETYGGIKFYETAHVKDILSYLKIKVNIHDEIAWHRILMLLEGIGTKTVERLTTYISEQSSIDNVIKVLASHSKNSKKAHSLNSLIKVLENAFQINKNDVGAIFDIFFEYYKPLMKNKYDDWHIRINDLETLRQVASRYKDLEDMLADFAIEPPERSVYAQEPETKDEDRPLCISTIHSSKGLEWDTVIIMGVIDGIIPISFCLDNEEEIEEEKRLLYVAITRAKKRLSLTLHHEGKRGGIMQFNKLSRFLTPPAVHSSLDVSLSNKEYDNKTFSQTQIPTCSSDLLKKIFEYYRN